RLVARPWTLLAFWRGINRTNPLSITTLPACSGSLSNRPAARRRATTQKMGGQPALYVGLPLQ
ncbi:MAG TPA: hypothetical protein VK775_24150, partial [Chthoniobacterales bacterium]|nr:hypothetical protein [Chthoniobacterales bacterium]